MTATYFRSRNGVIHRESCGKRGRSVPLTVWAGPDDVERAVAQDPLLRACRDCRPHQEDVR